MSDIFDNENEFGGLEELLGRSMTNLAEQAPTAIPAAGVVTVNVLDQHRRRQILARTAAAVTTISVAAASVALVVWGGDESTQSRTLRVAEAPRDEPTSSTTSESTTSVAELVSSTTAPTAPVVASTTTTSVHPPPATSAPAPVPAQTTKDVSGKVILTEVPAGATLEMSIDMAAFGSLFQGGTTLNEYLGAMYTANPQFGQDSVLDTSNNRYTLLMPVRNGGELVFIFPPLNVPADRMSIVVRFRLRTIAAGNGWIRLDRSNFGVVALPLEPGANEVRYDSRALGVTIAAPDASFDPTGDLSTIPTGGLVYYRTATNFDAAGSQVVAIAGSETVPVAAGLNLEQAKASVTPRDVAVPPPGGCGAAWLADLKGAYIRRTNDMSNYFFMLTGTNFLENPVAIFHTSGTGGQIMSADCLIQPA